MNDLDDLLHRLFAFGGPSPAAAAATAILSASPSVTVPPPPPKPTIDPQTPPHPRPLPGLEQALRAAAPHLTPEEAAAWTAVMTEPLGRADITGSKRIAAFVGQCSVESSGFRVLEENLNYSAPRLKAVWPQRFPTDQAASACAYNPEKLADTVYCNRLGNRDPESGDGWHFRGRGLIQITGPSGHTQYHDLIIKGARTGDAALQPLPVPAAHAATTAHAHAHSAHTEAGPHAAHTPSATTGLVPLPAPAARSSTLAELSHGAMR